MNEMDNIVYAAVASIETDLARVKVIKETHGLQAAVAYAEGFAEARVRCALAAKRASEFAGAAGDSSFKPEDVQVRKTDA